MVELVSGDILQSKCEYLAQGVAVGSQEGLGTGLAFKISRKWPDAPRQFKKFTQSHKFAGGDLFVSEPDIDRPGIIYIATQPDMYRASISFLNRGLKNLVKFCETNQVKSVSIPKIGSGLGKLDWEGEVKNLVLQHLGKSPTVFRVYEDFNHKVEEQA